MISWVKRLEKAFGAFGVWGAWVLGCLGVLESWPTSDLVGAVSGPK